MVRVVRSIVKPLAAGIGVAVAAFTTNSQILGRTARPLIDPPKPSGHQITAHPAPNQQYAARPQNELQLTWKYLQNYALVLRTKVHDCS
jgi:hypothetical protein